MLDLCSAQASPIVRVAVESARPAEMPQLEEGLRLLNRADPFVEVSVLDSGEYVIGAAGECLSIGSAAIPYFMTKKLGIADDVKQTLHVSPALHVLRSTVEVWNYLNSSKVCTSRK